jgi:DNA-binding transcriptional ArsR family regulator
VIRSSLNWRDQHVFDLNHMDCLDEPLHLLVLGQTMGDYEEMAMIVEMTGLAPAEVDGALRVLIGAGLVEAYDIDPDSNRIVKLSRVQDETDLSACYFWRTAKALEVYPVGDRSRNLRDRG